MKPSLAAAALLAAFAMPSLAAEQGAASDPGSEVAVRFVDRPTGFTYVWRPDAGWKFEGQGATDAARPLPVSSADGYAAGTVLSEFIDATTGFRFVWRQGAGWEFAGKATPQQGEPS